MFRHLDRRTKKLIFLQLISSFLKLKMSYNVIQEYLIEIKESGNKLFKMMNDINSESIGRN